MIRLHSEFYKGERWLEKYRGKKPVFGGVFAFTETGLIEGISAAGKTPEDRCYTAVADAEFLVRGFQEKPVYALPPLTVGVSPAIISRGVILGCDLEVYLFNAGLRAIPSVPMIDLEGVGARCVSTGRALPLSVVRDLFDRAVSWGEQLSRVGDYLILGECVVGGTTTALAVLTGLGYDVQGKVNSSHPCCNHEQKWQVVQQGLSQLGNFRDKSPWEIIAGVGDPMQIVTAGMAMGASRSNGVLLAGGTQMLAVYGLILAIFQEGQYSANLAEIVVGTTRWVVEDKTADSIGLAQLIPSACLLSSQLSFAESRYPALLAYEQGFVKEGVGAGGCAIAASLYRNWGVSEILESIESVISE